MKAITMSTNRMNSRNGFLDTSRKRFMPKIILDDLAHKIRSRQWLHQVRKMLAGKCRYGGCHKKRITDFCEYHQQKTNQYQKNYRLKRKANVS